MSLTLNKNARDYVTPRGRYLSGSDFGATGIVNNGVVREGAKPVNSPNSLRFTPGQWVQAAPKAPAFGALVGLLQTFTDKHS